MLSVFLEAAERRALYTAARAEDMSASRLARQLLVAGLAHRRARRRRKDGEMACHVKLNHHGYLAYHLFWQGRRTWEGTGLRDTPHNRARVEARATIMTEEMAAGAFDYLHWFRRATWPTSSSRRRHPSRGAP
jgi:hypothetical protein